MTAQEYKKPYLFQMFVGRHQDANILDHPEEVFSRLMTFDWEHISRLGFMGVYLLGAWNYEGPLVVDNEEGVDLTSEVKRTPSLFAISDHRQTHPILGSFEQFCSLVELIKSHDLKVFVDFVQNQTSLSHPWIERHPEYYLYSQDNQLVKGFSGDVAMLNLEHQAVREQHKRTLDRIFQAGVNGVRCDMAHLAPAGFWKDMIDTVRQHHSSSLFMAEAYVQSPFDIHTLDWLIEEGFDFIYDQYTYENSQSDSRHISLHELSSHIGYIVGESKDLSMAHYIANHDDPLGENDIRQEALLLLLSSMGGVVLIPDGQISGKKSRLSHHTIDILDSSQSLFSDQPQWFVNIAMVTQALGLSMQSIKALDSSVILVDIHMNNRPGQMLLNLGDTAFEIPSSISMIGEGLLHGLSPGESLPAGKGEVYFIDN